VRNDERQGYWARLTELERELRRVQRELALERPKLDLPTGRFEAVRVLIGQDEYAVQCDIVREIVRYARLTRIPGASEVMAGALNLRGAVVPVVDVPRRLGLGATRLDLKTPIVVISVHGAHVGLLVDRVADVVTLDGALIEKVTGGLGDSPFVSATASVSGRLVQLLHLDEVVSRAELDALEKKLSASDAHNDVDDPQAWEPSEVSIAK
jgi:purine-binding chemotaxis protein CheW